MTTTSDARKRLAETAALSNFGAAIDARDELVVALASLAEKDAEVERLTAQLGAIAALAEKWAEYGEGSSYQNILGKQVVTVDFAVSTLRAILAEPAGVIAKHEEEVRAGHRGVEPDTEMGGVICSECGWHLAGKETHVGLRSLEQNQREHDEHHARADALTEPTA